MDFDEVSQLTNQETGPQQNIEEVLFLDQEQKQQHYSSLKDCVIFLIDCSESMLKANLDLIQKEETTTTAISSILDVTEHFLKTKIISNEKDLFGLVAYNTEYKNNIQNFDGVNVLIDVASPDAKLIKQIKNMRQKCDFKLCPNNFLDNVKEIFKPFSKEEKNYLGDALWVIQSIFQSYPKTNFKRRIFLFTDNDNPFKNKPQEANLVLQKAKDMSDSEIVIELFPMNFFGKFNLQKFYENIIPANSEEEDENNNVDNILSIEQCSNRLRELTKRIRQKEIKKRTLGKFPFMLSSHYQIYLNVYSTVRKADKGRSYNVDAKSNKLLSAANQMIDKDSGQKLYPNNIGTYQLYGNKKVIFTQEEMKKIKTIQSPGMQLLGFKSIKSIKPYFNVGPSYFLYPNDIITKGAGTLCDGLIKQLVAKDKCAIVKYVGREGAQLKICALVPQREQFDEDYFQTPPGFNMIVLPWADDIRSSSDLLSKMPDHVPEPNNEEKELAKKLIKKMNISFDCRSFENVSLQKFYATLQALALEENDIEPVEDTMQPHVEALERVLKGTDEDLRQSIFGDEGGKEEYIKNKLGVKKYRGNKSRSRSKSPAKKKSKKDKMDIEDDKESSNDKKEVYSDESLKTCNLSKFTVPELKDICKLKGLSTKGRKKAELIEAITNYLNNN